MTEKALRKLLEWAVECDFGFDNIEDIYEQYKDKLNEELGYTEQLIQLATLYLEDCERKMEDGKAD